MTTSAVLLGQQACASTAAKSSAEEPAVAPLRNKSTCLGTIQDGKATSPYGRHFHLCLQSLQATCVMAELVGVHTPNNSTATETSLRLYQEQKLLPSAALLTSSPFCSAAMEAPASYRLACNSASRAAAAVYCAAASIVQDGTIECCCLPLFSPRAPSAAQPWRPLPPAGWPAAPPLGLLLQHAAPPPPAAPHLLASLPLRPRPAGCPPAAPLLPASNKTEERDESCSETSWRSPFLVSARACAAAVSPPQAAHHLCPRLLMPCQGSDMRGYLDQSY